MTPELREVHEALWREVAWLHLKWSIIMQLHGTPDGVALLNRSAPRYFAIGQMAWLQDIYLGFCRLTDPPRSLGKDNLCFERYLDLIDVASHAGLRQKVATLVVDLQSHCEFARDHRNRRIAHSDLLTKLGRHTQPLAQVTKAEIEGAFERCRTLINEVEFGYGQPSTLFGFDDVGDGTDVLLLLRDAEAWEAAERTRERALFEPPDAKRSEA
jgi:hypothetical protein